MVPDHLPVTPGVPRATVGSIAPSRRPANRYDFFMAVLLRMRLRAVIDPKFALAEQKYRRSEKSGFGRNCSLHFSGWSKGIAKIHVHFSIEHGPTRSKRTASLTS